MLYRKLKEYILVACTTIYYLLQLEVGIDVMASRFSNFFPALVSCFLGKFCGICNTVRYTPFIACRFSIFDLKFTVNFASLIARNTREIQNFAIELVLFST